VGRVIGKAVLDGVPIAASFHPLLFRALLHPRTISSASSSGSGGGGGGLSVNLHDLEAFSPQDARSCRQLLALPDVGCLYLSFEEQDGGHDVTSGNVKHYVRRRAHHGLLGETRARRLESLRKGFQAVPLRAHLRLFTVFELTALVCGKATLTAAELLPRLVFKGFPQSSTTPASLALVLRSFSDQQRLKFVSFVTASAALPPMAPSDAVARSGGGAATDDDDDNEEDESEARGGGASSSGRGSGMITVQRVAWERSRFPLAHTCFDRLDLPDYGDEGTLRQRLTWCLDNLEMAGFGES